jgi:hypothetical protein
MGKPGRSSKKAGTPSWQYAAIIGAVAVAVLMSGVLDAEGSSEVAVGGDAVQDAESRRLAEDLAIAQRVPRPQRVEPVYAEVSLAWLRLKSFDTCILV